MPLTPIHAFINHSLPATATLQAHQRAARADLYHHLQIQGSAVTTQKRIAAAIAMAASLFLTFAFALLSVYVSESSAAVSTYNSVHEHGVSQHQHHRMLLQMTPTPAPSRKSLKAAAIVGIVVGCAVGVIAAVLFCYWLKRRTVAKEDALNPDKNRLNLPSTQAFKALQY